MTQFVLRFQQGSSTEEIQKAPDCVPYCATLEARLPIYWVPVLGSLCKLILPITQEPTMWVPGLLGLGKVSAAAFNT